MRLWSLHPKYLDPKGLVALWREALLAKAVLSGQTKGYRNHPQLDRFKEEKDPLERINQYLSAIYYEAESRGYRFNRDKIDWNIKSSTMAVTQGQLDYEKKHLLNKLKKRDPKKHHDLIKQKEILPHPLFIVTDGGIASWEVIL